MMRAALISAVLSIFSVSCVALFDPPPDRIHITSNPPGARVTLAPGGEYTTPCDAAFDRTIELTNIEIAATGFVTERIAVKANGGRFLLILDALTIVGIIGDVLITGALAPYPDDPIHVDLRPSVR